MRCGQPEVQTNQNRTHARCTILCHTETTCIAKCECASKVHPSPPQPAISISFLLVHANPLQFASTAAFAPSFISRAKQTSAETLAGPDYRPLQRTPSCFMASSSRTLAGESWRTGERGASGATGERLLFHATSRPDIPASRVQLNFVLAQQTCPRLRTRATNAWMRGAAAGATRSPVGWWECLAVASVSLMIDLRAPGR